MDTKVSRVTKYKEKLSNAIALDRSPFDFRGEQRHLNKRLSFGFGGEGSHFTLSFAPLKEASSSRIEGQFILFGIEDESGISYEEKIAYPANMTDINSDVKLFVSVVTEHIEPFANRGLNVIAAELHDDCGPR